tara:strand:+ start:801 stop:959 length:159 start_codon:yes stop_codon:yes gene_type:complete
MTTIAALAAVALASAFTALAAWVRMRHLEQALKYLQGEKIEQREDQHGTEGV